MIWPKQIDYALQLLSVRVFATRLKGVRSAVAKTIFEILSYCQIFHANLGHHRHAEETLFPAIEELARKLGLMAANVEQYKEVRGVLHACFDGSG
jgi:hypothetical protein